MKWGAGLRASQALVRGGKARALMHGRYHVSIKDIQALAKPILRHRIMTNFYAESERINAGRHRRAADRGGAGAEERECSHARSAVAASGGSSIRRSSRGSARSSCRRGRSSKGSCRACTAARSRASASSSPSTGSTCPATISSTIDWKVYARSDRYYVKKFEEETNLECHLLLDVSGSMGYGSRGMTKCEYGACLAASLAYLMNRQRDAVGLIGVRRQIVGHAAGELAAGPSARAAARSIALRPARATDVGEAAASARRRAVASAAWSC